MRGENARTRVFWHCREDDSGKKCLRQNMCSRNFNPWEAIKMDVWSTYSTYSTYSMYSTYWRTPRTRHTPRTLYTLRTRHTLCTPHTDVLHVLDILHVLYILYVLDILHVKHRLFVYINASIWTKSVAISYVRGIMRGKVTDQTYLESGASHCWGRERDRPWNCRTHQPCNR